MTRERSRSQFEGILSTTDYTTWETKHSERREIKQQLFGIAINMMNFEVCLVTWPLNGSEAVELTLF